MKKHLSGFFLLFIFCLVLEAQPTEKVKTGWNMGILPSVMYDSDVGFQYGALLNLFQYGDGSHYPNYRYVINAEWSRQTKGGAINQLLFDAPNLLPKDLRLTIDLSYLTEKALDFYGFNGRSASYNAGFEDVDDPAYISRMYYRHQRKMMRMQFDLQGRLNDKLRWIGGLGYFDFQLATVDIGRLNKGKDIEDLLPDTALLYDHYVSWGLLPPAHAAGGSHLVFKTGIIYDTRDNEPNPMKGSWNEFLLMGSPPILGENPVSFIRYAFIHRQYFTLKKDVLSFAYRLGMQGTLAGETPFYFLSHMMCSFDKATNRDGLGGARTLRGILRNRVVGDGMAYANLELRWKFIRTVLWNQNVYLALNTFTDAGLVTVPYAFDINKVHKSVLPSSRPDAPHLASGAGLRIAMNQNFIIALDYGKAWSSQDGNSGVYINLGYLF